MTRVKMTAARRFWAKVDTSGGPSACWPWTGYVDGRTGYGQFHDGDRLVKAHRFSYGLANHTVPLGLVVDHECHNDAECKDVPCAHRSCCNPAHLEAVTQAVNSIRGRTGDHQLAKTHCPHGHEYTPENTILRNEGKHRVCRACRRIHQNNYNARRKAAA